MIKIGPVRYESVHETGKAPYGFYCAITAIERHRLTAGEQIEGREWRWDGAILGRNEGYPLAPNQVLVSAPTADEARKQLAAALRKIADDLDQTQLP